MKIETLLDYQTILANQARPVHFAIRLTAVEGSVTPRSHPAAFCLVLDRSGSMGGPPLEHAKQAAIMAIRHLRPEDHFALIAFDDVARTLIPLQTAKDKQEMEKAVLYLSSGDSTNLTAGWMLGQEELAKAPSGASRRLLVLSDGHLNTGIVQPDQVRHIVAAGLQQGGIRTSCLGFGAAYNEELMADLARVTGGQFYDAESPEQLPAIFTAELDGLQKISAQNVRVRLKAGDFCDSLAALTDAPAVSLPDGRVEYSVGDLISGEERILCFATRALPLPCINGKPVASLEGEELLQVEVVFDQFLESGIEPRQFQQTIRIQATQDPAVVVPNGQVITWVSLQKAAQTLRQVNQAMDNGRPDEAGAILRDCVQQLQAYGPKEAVAEAIRSLDDVERNIEEGWSPRARKSSRYRMASYAKMSSAEAWTLAGEAKPSFKARAKREKR